MAANSMLRIGAVTYLNTKPLVYGLQRRLPDAQLVFDLPSRLADDLAARRLDVALIPSVESFQDPRYQIVSDACIACRGPVLSVKLFGRTPADRIRSLALDEGSRTSAALAKVILARQFSVSPHLVALPIGASVDDTDADAVLLIGDRAMHSPPGKFAFVWDLGDVWCRWTSVPFVFAMWTARPEVDTSLLVGALAGARDDGVARLTEIAATEAARQGLTEPECLNYLSNNLHFALGPRERQGLALFRRYATELGLAPEESAVTTAVQRPAAESPLEPSV